MAALGGGETIGSGETLLVEQLQPCHIIFRIRRCEVEIPRNETDCLAHCSQCVAHVAAAGLKKLVFLIPQVSHNEMAQRIGFLIV